MDLAQSFTDIVTVVNRSTVPLVAWKDLLAYLESHSRAPIADLRQVDVAEDLAQVTDQLLRIVRSDPLRPSVDAIYFGLFDTVDDTGAEGIGFYVAGIEGFDPNDGDSLCDPAWWPDGRYLESVTLSAVRAAELTAKRSQRAELGSILGYAGQLGTAMLLAKFAGASAFPSHRIVVGFDSGDFAELER